MTGKIASHVPGFGDVVYTPEALEDVTAEHRGRHLRHVRQAAADASRSLPGPGIPPDAFRKMARAEALSVLAHCAARPAIARAEHAAMDAGNYYAESAVQDSNGVTRYRVRGSYYPDPGSPFRELSLTVRTDKDGHVLTIAEDNGAVCLGENSTLLAGTKRHQKIIRAVREKMADISPIEVTGPVETMLGDRWTISAAVGGRRYEAGHILTDEAGEPVDDTRIDSCPPSTQQRLRWYAALHEHRARPEYAGRLARIRAETGPLMKGGARFTARLIEGTGHERESVYDMFLANPEYAGKPADWSFRLTAAREDMAAIFRPDRVEDCTGYDNEDWGHRLADWRRTQVRLRPSPGTAGRDARFTPGDCAVETETNRQGVVTGVSWPGPEAEPGTPETLEIAFYDDPTGTTRERSAAEIRQREGLRLADLFQRRRTRDRTVARLAGPPGPHRDHAGTGPGLRGCGSTR